MSLGELISTIIIATNNSELFAQNIYLFFQASPSPFEQHSPKLVSATSLTEEGPDSVWIKRGGPDLDPSDRGSDLSLRSRSSSNSHVSSGKGSSNGEKPKRGKSKSPDKAKKTPKAKKHTGSVPKTAGHVFANVLVKSNVPGDIKKVIK